MVVVAYSSIGGVLHVWAILHNTLCRWRWFCDGCFEGGDVGVVSASVSPGCWLVVLAVWVGGGVMAIAGVVGEGDVGNDGFRWCRASVGLGRCVSCHSVLSSHKRLESVVGIASSSLLMMVQYQQRWYRVGCRGGGGDGGVCVGVLLVLADEFAVTVVLSPFKRY